MARLNGFKIFYDFNIIGQQYSNIFRITSLRVLGTISISYDLVREDINEKKRFLSGIARIP